MNAKMTSIKGKWTVTIPQDLVVTTEDGGERPFKAGTIACKDAEEAASMVNAYNDGADAIAAAEKLAAEQAASQPLIAAVNPAGELVVRFGDRALNNYPVIQADLAQLECLIAHFPIVVKAVEANRSKLAANWQAAAAWRKANPKQKAAKV